jgi:hypothetical protein
MEGSPEEVQLTAVDDYVNRLYLNLNCREREFRSHEKWTASAKNELEYLKEDP